MYVRCVAGVLQQDEYLSTIWDTGFHNIQIRKSKTIDLPDQVLRDYLTEKQIALYNKSQAGNLSITVVGQKQWRLQVSSLRPPAGVGVISRPGKDSPPVPDSRLVVTRFV